MPNPFHHFWLFVYAVGDHAFTLAAGCVLTVVINLIEKYAMGGKRLPLKADIAVLLSFVFFASFQAWRDEYDTACKVQTTPAIQITMPPIAVPPAQVIVTPAPALEPSHDLTGFVELAKSDMVTKTIAKDLPISVNVGFVAKGSQPIHGMAYITTDIVADFSKKLDEDLEKTSEKELRRIFSVEVEKAKKDIVQKKFEGHKLGIGNGIIWSTASSSPLTEAQVNGLVTGQTRLYVLSWATWKDSNNRVGSLETCQWLQAPTSLDLSSQQVVWHLCTWIP
jgi:hypothetical protein